MRASRRRPEWRIGRDLAPANHGRFCEAIDRRGNLAVAKIASRSGDAAHSRIANEIEIVASLNERGLLDVVGVGEHRDALFYVTPMMKGPPRHTDSDGLARSVLHHVGTTLLTLHGMGVAHRDVRPHNIVWQGEIPRLVDYGLAQMLEPDSRTSGVGPLGSLPFMAPEILIGAPSDSSVDIWALGVTLHVIAAGRGVYPTMSDTDVTSALATLARSRPDIADGLAPDLGTTIRWCLDGPARRCRDITTLLQPANETGLLP